MHLGKHCDKLNIFGPLIPFWILVVELFHCLQSIIVKTTLGSYNPANHAGVWWYASPATN